VQRLGGTGVDQGRRHLEGLRKIATVADTLGMTIAPTCFPS
jgi:hypothetical protein